MSFGETLYTLRKEKNMWLYALQASVCALFPSY